ncbi:hypothetical protein NEMBOFW57_002775 [Staphylotrichum longicolle]|uniref:Uncharacterized protein n=1 Tax=Staphylotrichum longicolle TaxID=669026 RepID=A0AAD4F4E9_9PEZI|nr:hypothetical protein NEMBOFW57_002775 [Staphylotrichum longicolle]
MRTLRKACRDAFSVFSGAGQDMGILISRLREMNASHTADTLTRPLLVQKLGGVARLCQSRLDGHVKNGSLEDDLTYRVKLFEAVRRTDNALDVSDEVNVQVNEFIKRCFRGETNKLHHPPAKDPEKNTRNANDALEVFLGGIISRLEENSERSNPPKAETAIDIASEDSDIPGIEFLN